MRSLIIVCLMAVLLVVMSLESRADVINGDFEPSLNGWSSEGNVSIVNGEAVLSDFGVIESRLYQGISLGPGSYKLTFDFLADPSISTSNNPPYSFPDYFAASLYFTNYIEQFSLSYPNSYSDEPLYLIDLQWDSVDYHGNDAEYTSGNLTWVHFCVNFQNEYDYVIPIFELFDMDTGNDHHTSSIKLDNVIITSAPVPEPSTLLLMGSGILGLAGALRKKRGKGLKVA